MTSQSKVRLFNLSIFILASVSIIGGLILSRSAYASSTTPSIILVDCPHGNDLLGFPTWYQYLKCDSVTKSPVFYMNPTDSQHFDPTSVLLIGMAIVVILMRLAGILAVVFVVIGGIKYTTSQGNPEGLQNAKNTIVNALIGLILTFLASGIVSFIARSIH